MQLSKLEEAELTYLNDFPNNKIMSEYQIKRRKYLKEKEWHNNCTTTNCKGFHGMESETHCPYCGNELFKSKLINNGN